MAIGRARDEGPADARRSAGREWRIRQARTSATRSAWCAAGDEVEDLDLGAIGPGIESNTELFPDRTNVSFTRVDGSTVRARIFERGVGETLSSGTGASGAAVAAFLEGAPSPITVQLDGGELDGRDHRRARDDADRAPRSRSSRASSREELVERLEDGLAQLACSRPMGRTDPSQRLEAIPPYMFAELERKVADKKAAGHRRDLARASATRTRPPTRTSSRRCRRRSRTPERTSTRRTAAARSSARRSRASTTAASASRSTPRPR